MDTRVSMVAAPWRALMNAALWNGHAPHTTTGAASVSESHCQYVNCRAGIIANAMTGIDSATLPIRRFRSPVSSGSASFVSLSGSTAGSAAV